ncbi:MAG: NUDIX hydrolase [Bacteriovoracaceae bacterium]|jgi:ADP-ribose pyrophosphatase|nr:NUDIX hydrolase [Bacteriovoracaceae bacterium]
MISKWKVLSRKTYTHSPYRSIEDVEFELPTGERQIYSLKKEGSAVAVLAFDCNGEIILARQYRPGPDQILDEIPGGGIDGNESAPEAAKRELLEETGYFPGELIQLSNVLECAYSTIDRYAFIAKNCQKIGEPSPDEHEFIEVITKSKEEFIDQLVKGRISDPEVGWMGLYHLSLL